MIDVVDRIGKTHLTGELVYAYFDTSTEKYIVLDKFLEPITPTIYGTYYPSDINYGYIIVEHATGIERCGDYMITKGSSVMAKNKIGAPTDFGRPAIAIKMEKLQ